MLTTQKVFSSVATVLEKFRNSGLKDRYVSVFGNKSWSGGGVSGIDAFVEEIGWEKIGRQLKRLILQKSHNLLHYKGSQANRQTIKR